jgi:hypothetical protein
MGVEQESQRRVWPVRLAAWGTVVVLAVVAFNVRTGAGRTEYGANGAQVNGETSQRMPIWAVVGDGRVREMRMAWRFDCDNDAEVRGFGVTLRDSVDGFTFRGRRFGFEDEREIPSADGWTARATVSVTGRTDRRGGAAGRSSATVRFSRGAVRGATCRSGPVRWSATRR